MHTNKYTIFWWQNNVLCDVADKCQPQFYWGTLGGLHLLPEPSHQRTLSKFLCFVWNWKKNGFILFILVILIHNFTNSFIRWHQQLSLLLIYRIGINKCSRWILEIWKQSANHFHEFWKRSKILGWNSQTFAEHAWNCFSVDF